MNNKKDTDAAWQFGSVSRQSERQFSEGVYSAMGTATALVGLMYDGAQWEQGG